MQSLGKYAVVRPYLLLDFARKSVNRARLLFHVIVISFLLLAFAFTSLYPHFFPFVTLGNFFVFLPTLEKNLGFSSFF